MSFPVVFYSFSKKVNSTKRPTGSTSPQTTANVTLKKDSDILNPTLLVSDIFKDGGSFYTPNYVYIAKFNRYYYISTMTWSEGLWNVTCTVDVLATYRTEIGGQSQYILRSSAESDGEIIDTLYPSIAEPTTEVQGITSPWTYINIEDAYYVVGIGGQSTAYYVFTYVELQTFLDYLYSDSFANALVPGFATAFPELKALSNPLQYITSIMWFPFDISGGTLVNPIRVGWVDVPLNAEEVDGSATFYLRKSIVIQYRHPQASTRGNYLNFPPYSKYEIFYPPFGKFELEGDIVGKTVILDVDVAVDLRTGNATLTVQDRDDRRLALIEAQVGVNYQISQVINKGYGTAQIAQSAGTAIGSILSLDFGNTIQTSLGMIGDSAKASVPSVTTIGSNGGSQALLGPIQITSTFKTLIDEDLTNKGRPLCTTKTISTIPGYIQVDRANISIDTLEGEQEQIRSYLEGGFYYE